MARVSASSGENVLMIEDLNLTMWLDSLKVQRKLFWGGKIKTKACYLIVCKFRGNCFDGERWKLNDIARVSGSSGETFFIRED